MLFAMKSDKISLLPNVFTMEQGTELIRKIDSAVTIANQDADWRREYMTFAQAQMDARREGEAIGVAKGEVIGAEKKARETAQQLFRFGIPLKVIAESVGEPEQKVAGWLQSTMI